MTVLYIIDSLKGYGAETSLVEITTRFKKIKPIFVQVYEGDQLKRRLELEGIKVYSLNLSGKYNFPSAERSVLAIIDREKPHIIHSTLFRADIIARRIKKKIPHILLVGSIVNNSYSSYRLKKMNISRRVKHILIREWDKLTSKYVDYFISNSEAIIRPNLQALNIKREKIEVIYRGRDLSVFSEKGDDSHLLLFERKGIVFLNVSRLEDRKGQKDLVEAFYHFLRLEPSATLIIAGDGPERENLERLIHRLDMEKSIYLIGYRRDVPELLRIADFFVFPTYFEGLPGALIEAILSKTPVIASNILENRECLAPDSALLFSPGNIREITSCLFKALSLSDWEQKTELAFDHARSRFDINRVSKQYEEFYLRIYDKLQSSN